MTASPPVKWVGGKTRLLPELLARMPARFGRYYEPFCGGAALFFKLAPERAVLGDANPELMNLYRVLARGDVEQVIEFLRAHAESHLAQHEYYYQVRRLWNRSKAWTEIQRAAAFVYLNKTCFNGLWRVNADGEFNVPKGDYKSPTICDAEGLRAAAAALARAELREGNYWSTVLDAEPGDLVYMDPPYVPLTKTSSFTSYTEGGFGLEDQRLLAGGARMLMNRGVHVVLSNSDAPLVHELYTGFRIDRVQCGRGINSDASKRGAVSELIISSPGAAALAPAA